MHATPPPRSGLSRQEPVSCQLCRQRKLRCSRQIPCSNCEARGIKCSYANRTPSAPVAHYPKAAGRTLSDLQSENAAIKSRLAKLEHAIGAHLGSIAGLAPSCESEGGNIANSGRHLPQSKPAQTTTTSSSDNSPLARVQVVEFAHLAQHFEVNDVKPSCIPIPPLAEGMVLFEHYRSFIHPFQPITHCPTIKLKLESIYANASRGLASKAVDVALLTIIFSNAAFYCEVDDEPYSWFGSRQNTITVYTKWAKLAFESLWPPRGTNCLSIEAVQAFIQYAYLVHLWGGMTPSVYMLHSFTVIVARDLGLHRIDCDEFLNPTRQEIIDQEIGRRVWWHLTSTDWHLASLPGQAEGTYSIHSRHMKVNRPRNITDEDLLVEDANFNRPLSEPTPLVYLTFRLRLGEISRVLVDTSYDRPCAMVPWEQDYQGVLFADGLFDKAFEDMPICLRYNDDGSPVSQYSSVRYPYLNSVRHIANAMFWTKRFRLHRPYIDLAMQNDQFAFSGQMCLRSAKRLLSMRCPPPPTSDPATQLRFNASLQRVLHGIIMMYVRASDEVQPSGIARATTIRDAEVAAKCAPDVIDTKDSFLAFLKSTVDEYEAHVTQPFLLNVGNNWEMDMQNMLLSTNGNYWPDGTTIDLANCGMSRT